VCLWCCELGLVCVMWCGVCGLCLVYDTEAATQEAKYMSTHHTPHRTNYTTALKTSYPRPDGGVMNARMLASTNDTNATGLWYTIHCSTNHLSYTSHTAKNHSWYNDPIHVWHQGHCVSSSCPVGDAIGGLDWLNW